MTPEEKQLLLKVLCAMLPYGVICTDNRHGDSRIFNVDIEDESVYYTDFDEYGLVENCKLYLRPMSSMTEEERNEYLDVKMQECERVALAEVYRPEAISIVFDWLNAHHFDYCGLIEKGLALEAPEGMYKDS